MRVKVVHGILNSYCLILCHIFERRKSTDMNNIHERWKAETTQLEAGRKDLLNRWTKKE
jgi:hypothetical protein